VCTIKDLIGEGFVSTVINKFRLIFFEVKIVLKNKIPKGIKYCVNALR
jgi:hypothetical protein